MSLHPYGWCEPTHFLFLIFISRLSCSTPSCLTINSPLALLPLNSFETIQPKKKIKFIFYAHARVVNFIFDSSSSFPLPLCSSIKINQNVFLFIFKKRKRGAERKEEDGSLFFKLNMQNIFIMFFNFLVFILRIKMNS